MTNPFDWKNQPPKISMRDVDIAQKQAYQQTAVINRKRAQGIEPSIIYSLKKHDAQPKKFVAEMPPMEVHPSTLRTRRRKSKKDKNEVPPV